MGTPSGRYHIRTSGGIGHKRTVVPEIRGFHESFCRWLACKESDLAGAPPGTLEFLFPLQNASRRRVYSILLRKGLLSIQFTISSTVSDSLP
jgi:hypothetical protein